MRYVHQLRSALRSYRREKPGFASGLVIPLDAEHSQFRGRTRDGDVRAYVSFLMQETDLRLGLCDWGYCVYRVETAACFGDEKGPNPVLKDRKDLSVLRQLCRHG